jgi:hypothetical protein
VRIPGYKEGPIRIAPFRRKGYGNLPVLEQDDIVVDEDHQTIFFNGRGKHVRRPRPFPRPHPNDDEMVPSDLYDPADLPSSYFSGSDVDWEVATAKSAFTSADEMTDDEDAKKVAHDLGGGERDEGSEGEPHGTEYPFAYFLFN